MMRLPHIDTMTPRTPLDWAVTFLGGLAVILLPLALAVFAGAVIS